MTYSLPRIDELGSLSRSDQAVVVDHLFEPCSTLTSFITTRILQNGNAFASYEDFIHKVRVELHDFLESEESKSNGVQREIHPDIAIIIAAHPRLGPSKDQAHLSSHSSSEQKSLAGTKEEAQKISELNDEYEARFPGLRYVVFVNGRSREQIMQNMRDRIRRNDISAERKDAFNAMCDIAVDRAHKLEAKL